MLKFIKQVSLLTVILSTIIQFSSHAQTNIGLLNKVSVSSPTAASLGKYGDIPVNYHTGIPQIEIPIYTATAGPLSLPVSISYHASGLKVQEPAGWVGAGWALNAGGVITRTVVGAPDERYSDPLMLDRPSMGHFSDYGYNNYTYIFDDPSEVLPNSAPNWDYFINGWRDGEPDLFFFNFGKYSGKFYFRDDRTPVIVPEADFKIEPYYNPTSALEPSIQSFTITTPDGAKYYFGKTPGLTGTPPIEITKPYAGYVGISSWFLNKVTSADEQFAISLSYVPESYGFHAISMFPVSEIPPPAGTYVSGQLTGYNLVKNVVQGVRLDKITFPAGSVNFTTDGLTARTDLSNDFWDYNSDAVNQNAKPLGGIELSDGTTVLKKFIFKYSYFEDNITPLPQEIQNFAPGIFTDKKRLKLDSIQEISGDGSISKPPYYFTYFNEQVLRRLNFGIDHWGFSNGVTSNQGLIPTYTKYGTSVTTNVPGADRDSYWPAMRAGTLQQIKYPTGGYSLFDFEPNSVYSTATNNVNVTLTALIVHLYGQSALTNSSSFTSNGSAMNIAFNNSADYTTTFTITNSSSVVVYTTSIGNGQYSSINPLTLPQGTYTATLSLPNTTVTGGCTANITQWQSVTTTNPITIGGNRIKTITHNDGVTANNTVTNYDYTGDNGLSSGILYNRPIYIGIVRNDIIKDVGYYQPGTGYVTSPAINGCVTIPDAVCFKSPNSIRPMANTQGNHIGYAQVKTSQTNNGYSKYKYYGTTGIPEWQANSGDVAVRTVNALGCDANAPNFPAAPLSYDYLRGELKYEAHYNQSGQMLREATYIPTFVTSIQKTPAFSVTNFRWSTTNLYLGTYYELTTARQTQMQVTETAYNPADGSSLSTTSTTYFESPFHNQPTRTGSSNSKGEVLETKNKYAYDFRLPACDAIADGYPQYNTDCTTCLNTYNTTRVNCGNNNSMCLSTAYFTYLYCKANARINYVNYRRSNFTNPANNFKTAHDNAKTTADADLKPILELQDKFMNTPVEVTEWKAGKLAKASFNKFDYVTNPPGNVYPSKFQYVNLQSLSTGFTAASVNGSGVAKDNRYLDESIQKFDNGNMVEITGKDGVITSYIWGYNQQYPVAKIVGKTIADALSQSGIVMSVVNNPATTDAAMRTELNKLRVMTGCFVTTYTYKLNTGISGETDPNGKTVYYEYDAASRLLRIRDFNNNIVKQYDYKYGVATSPVIYYNDAQSGAYMRTNCGSNFQGGTYTTNVAANTYTSTIDKADANQQALNYIAANGQTNANTYGSCTALIPVSYINAQPKSFSATFTNTATTQSYYFTINPSSSNASVISIPVGTYNVNICPSGFTGTYSYRVNTFYQSGVLCTSPSNLLLDCGTCASVQIY
jgi:YD repeat-containing protein